jgi:hypothetical protein
MSLGMGLFGLNYWHASKCASDRSPDEVEEMVAALKNRLLESESKVVLRSTQCLHLCCDCAITTSIQIDSEE